MDETAPDRAVGHRVVARGKPAGQARHQAGRGRVHRPSAVPGARGRVPLAFVVTDAPTGTVHLVNQDAMSAGCRVGRYVALCGGEVLAASLTTPASGHCRSCRDRRAGR